MNTSKKISYLLAASVFVFAGLAGTANAMDLGHALAYKVDREVNRLMAADSNLTGSNISVLVDGKGNVALTGSVSDPATADEALAVALQAPDARSVTSNIMMAH